MRAMIAGKLRYLLSQRRPRALILLASAFILVFGAFFVTVRQTHAASYCQVSYTISNQWQGGFGVQGISIQNTGTAAWTSWSLTFTFPAAGQAVTQGWNGNFTQSGQNVTVTNLSYNGAVAVNAAPNPLPGFNGAWTTSNPVPTNFAVNGNVCNGSGPPPTPTTAPTSTPITGPTATPTKVPTATPIPTVGPTPLPGTHVDNPYVGAKGYINPDWAAEVRAGATATGGTLGAKEALVANYSTAVWLDSMAAISGTNGYPRSLVGHLDAAVAQSTGGQPVVIQIVIYDLPGRDCAALASNGEIPNTAAGLSTYEHSYIDPIAAAINQAKYSNLRVVAIIEPDSLPNLVTNLGIAGCATANSNGNYVQGVQYALNKLHAISNVYSYIDIGHDGWLGWSSNFNPSVTLIANTVKGTTAGVNSIDGFISDTANYTPVTEPLMTANQTVGGNPVRSETPFYQWNVYIDEQTYDIDWRNAMISAGFPSTIGMLIDTSRDGWGGPARPTVAST
ncbi:MAG: glycoside hydrolase family 6 protein, partial [Ktedonobacterales bacterium]|nr:glycoside hydrolase family 6 protein [Ktedonobacterales bacterium]